MNKVVVATATVAGIITVGVMIWPSSDTVVVADNANDTQVDVSPVVKRTLEIYQSSEFQEEMKTLATARAMFELASEKQSEALELSEQAMIAYQKSKGMADDWHNVQMYASSTGNNTER